MSNTERSAPAPDVRNVYEAGTTRKIVFSLVFLLLLPFFVSLWPMMFWRITQNHWIGMPGFIIMAVAFTAIMGLLLIELLFSIRSRVAFGDKSVKITLPAGRGATPALRYLNTEIPYDNVSAVEVRREVYGGAVAPVTMKGARVILKEGDPVKLGYVNEANADPVMPFVEIGEKIAARAGVPINDLGHVRRSFANKIAGKRATGEQLKPITPVEIDEINQRHDFMMLGLVGLLVVLIGLGIASDRDHRLFGAAAPPAGENAARPSAQ